MTRAEAICCIVDAYTIMENDRCCSQEERDGVREELEAVFEVIGFLPEEVSQALASRYR